MQINLGRQLKDLAKKSKTVWLATDEDREGEAIAYHVAEQLGYEKDPDRFQRVTFHEITKQAVLSALEEGGGLEDAFYVDQSPYAHLDTFDELAKRNAGRVFEQMEFE